jgi:hypothetical protein
MLPLLIINIKVIKTEIITVYRKYPKIAGILPKEVKAFCVVPFMKNKGRCHNDQIIPSSTAAFN